MMRLALLLSVAGSLLQSQSEEPKLPPFTVVVTAQTGKLVPGDLAPLTNAIKRMKGYAELKSREKIIGDKDWSEEWTFEIPGEKKFDPTPLWNAFMGRPNAKRMVLTMTGTLSQEATTKKLFITSYSGKSKVKLMNKPKSDFDKSEGKVEDNVGKLTKLFDEGKLHYTVTGDIFSHGGTLAILLETFSDAPPPPPKPEEKK
jgi:hypothetical protein